jgi:hypothetical protein
MPDRTVLIDAGWFVGRWRRHLYAKRGLLARILAGVANGNCDPEKGIRAGRRAITQDLKYLAFRFRQFGLSSADVIVCYDGTLARQRRGALLETYKGNRIMIHPDATEKEAEEIVAAYRASESTIQDMRDHFTNFRFPVSLNDDWGHRYIDTHEADDLIAEYVVAAPATEQITIVSADSDLVQLLEYPNVQILDPTSGDALQSMVTPDDVRARYGISPDRYADWKALAGDSSDNIPGIPEVGGVGAAALITEHGSLEGIPDEVYAYGRVSESWRPTLHTHVRTWIDSQVRRDGSPAGDDLVGRRHGKLVLDLAAGKYSTRPVRFYQALADIGALPTGSWETVDLRPMASVYRRMIRLPFA